LWSVWCWKHRRQSPWSGRPRSACPELFKLSKTFSMLKGRHVVFPPLQSLHLVLAKYWAEGAGASSLQSRPCSMLLCAVPSCEEQAKRETVFQQRGPSKGMGWWVSPDPWGNVEQLVRRLVSKDSEVHRVWWKVFWKIVTIKGVLKTFLVPYTSIICNVPFLLSFPLLI
jgi:hypothetical protein